MSKYVRLKSGIAVPQDFAGAEGTPLVIDGDAGLGYYLKNNLVYPLFGAHVPLSYLAPSVMTVSPGTLDSGTVATLAVKDGVNVSVSEVPGTPGFQVQLEFHGVSHFEELQFFGRYSGSSTHFIAMEVLIPGPNVWENYGSFTTSDVAQWYRFPIVDPAEHVAAGVLKVRLRHIQSGNASHDLYLDLARLLVSYYTPS